MSVPTCIITGRIVGDSDACGDCDPCILGREHVPDAVKRLLSERDEWREKYASAAAELDRFECALTTIRDTMPIEIDYYSRHVFQTAAKALEPD